MADVQVKCPTTGEWVSTGMGADRSSWESTDYSGNSFTCSACQQQHTWSKNDARLAD